MYYVHSTSYLVRCTKEESSILVLVAAMYYVHRTSTSYIVLPVCTRTMYIHSTRYIVLCTLYPCTMYDVHSTATIAVHMYLLILLCTMYMYIVLVHRTYSLCTMYDDVLCTAMYEYDVRVALADIHRTLYIVHSRATLYIVLVHRTSTRYDVLPVCVHRMYIVHVRTLYTSYCDTYVHRTSYEVALLCT